LILKRSPAIEASLIYGVAMVLGFLIFAAAGGWQEAIRLSQGMAVVLQLPTWIVMVVAGKLQKRASKFGRFFTNVSVISLIAVGFVALIYGLSSGAKSTGLGAIQNTFNWVTAVYFIASLIGAVLTQFVFFRKVVEPRIEQSTKQQNTKNKK